MRLVFVIPALVCALWTVFAGKDVNWDLLNYHYYLPYELLGGRLQQDFFAASAQSYLNPLGYLPFYLMVSSGWHSVIVSLLLAAAHSLSIALLYLIAWRLFAHLPRRDRIVFSCLATALGAATAVFWPTVGSSFLDPLLVPLVLAGLLSLQQPVLAGALLGAAAALKYSNAIYLIAAFPLALLLRAGAAYTLGAAAAVALLAGPWLVLLWQEFGNPVFPLMNAWFQSPHAPAVNLVATRFAPQDIGEALAFPFRVIALDPAVYSEILAPDLRLAALLAAAVALPFKRGRLSAEDRGLLLFFACSFVLWLLTSPNARYGMVVLLLTGVVLARLAEHVLPLSAARIALGLLLVLQLVACALASPARWYIAEPWSRHWLPYQVPEHKPALYLTLEVQPMAAVAPFLHPASAFVNLRGHHSLAPDSPRLAALLERHRGAVRTLGRSVKPESYDDTLRRIGFRVDAADCFAIPWQPDAGDALSRAANLLAPLRPHPEPLSVTSCALRPVERDPAQLAAERRAAALFDRIEKACPRVFRGQTAVTEPLGIGWSRHYAGLDARLELHTDAVVLRRYRAGTHVELGRVSDWGPDERARLPRPSLCD